jgi:hypothetical protein
MSDGDGPAALTPARRSLKQRLALAFERYGRIALITYVVLSIGAIVGFSIGIGAGLRPSSATGVVGVIAAGWAAAKLTMPIRILITLGITPVIALVLKRRGQAVGAEPAPAMTDE